MFIRVTGAEQALRALRQMEPLTAREVGREVSGIGRMIAAATTAPDIAMRGWGTTAGSSVYRGSRAGSGGWPAYSMPRPSVQRRGMAVTVGYNGVAAAIYEYAGRANPRGLDARGRQFISNLPPLTQLSAGPNGRFLRRGLAITYRRAIQQMEDATNKAVNAVNRLMP